MSLVPMLKATLVARREDADPVLEALQDAGLIHIVPVEVPDALDDMELLPARDAHVREEGTGYIHEELETRRHALANVAPSPARLQVTDKSVPEVLDAVDALLERRSLAQQELVENEATIAALEPWGDIDFADVRALRDKGVAVTFALYTKDDWDALDHRRLTHAVAHDDGNRVWVVLFDAEPEGGAAVELPEERLSRLRTRREELSRIIAEVNRELGRYAHYEPTLRRMMDALADRAALLKAIDAGVVAGPLFALEGYLPKESAEDLRRALEPFAVALRLEDPAEDDLVPVQLRNNWFLRGFEAVVRNFSGISYREKDFTWAVGILFITFGSLCLLDAGYGVLLFLTGLGLQLKSGSPFGRVFMLTGAFATLVGALSGSLFGFMVGKDFMPGYMPPLTLAADPYSCFLFSLVVGMFALLFSYATAIWQRGLKTSATGSLLLVLAAMAAVFANLATEYVLTIANSWRQPSADTLTLASHWGNNVAIGCGALAVLAWLAFPDPVFGKDARMGNILWTLYSGTTGVLQDVLSHMRLFGIALSGAIMMLVVNQVGGQMPLPITIAFAVVGHIFVFLLSLLSLYIHTNRLIFLEYGSKCIEGGTLEYSPLRRRSLA